MPLPEKTMHKKEEIMRRNSWSQAFAFLAFCLPVVFVSAGCGGGSARTSSTPVTGGSTPPTYSQEAAFGIQTLQKWYVQSSGLYQSPSGWWETANSMTMLANYEHVTGDTTYESVLANTFAKAQATHANFINTYDDDEGWWALALIDAYDLTGNQSYLTMAETIFADIATEWDTTTCGGGVWWEKPSPGVTEYKNAIANELFLTVAARLANRTTGTASAGYLSWAQEEWTWFKASGMINSQNLINDGLTASTGSACINNGKTTWTYNQGVILGGLVELYKADQDPTLLPQAEAIATTTIASLTTPSGILTEWTISGTDAPQFKGVFMRNLMTLYSALPSTSAQSAQYKAFAQSNANSIWTNDQAAGYEFGAHWEGPFDSADATRQSSALDALVAAAGMK
jgi:predicted alpha-1,6-mannanase (GH76 family)